MKYFSKIIIDLDYTHLPYLYYFAINLSELYNKNNKGDIIINYQSPINQHLILLYEQNDYINPNFTIKSRNNFNIEQYTNTERLTIHRKYSSI
jgi:hypothetical protein